jgi:WD40 repeat protein
MQLMAWQRRMPRKFSPVAGVFLAAIVIVLVLGGSHLGQWLHPGQTITPRTVGNLEEVPILIRHDATIESTAFSPQPTADLSFVSSSDDGLIKLWRLDKDADTKQVAVTEQLAMQAGRRIALSPDGTRFASIDLEGSGAKAHCDNNR